MTVKADADALQDRFSAQWAISQPDVAAIYDNAPASDPAPGAPFVRFAVRPGEMSRRHIGTGQGPYRGQGRVWVQIFVPKGDGAAEADTLVDSIAAIYRRWRSPDGAVRTDNIEITTVPGDPAWHQVNVSVPYESWRIV